MERGGVVVEDKKGGGEKLLFTYITGPISRSSEHRQDWPSRLG